MVDNNFLRVRIGFRASLALFAVVLMISGCGGSGPTDDRVKGTVSGKVSIGSDPFTTGAVRFTPSESAGEAYGAEMQAGGEFEVAGPIPVGTYKVSLSPPAAGPIKGPDGQMRPATAEDLKHNIPQKLLSPDTSGKTVEIKEGDNTLTIELSP